MDSGTTPLGSYTEGHSQEEPELLKKLNRETHQKMLKPQMISGHFQGRVLSMLSKLVNPGSILEIGTYTGYSTLCLAEGLKTEGKLETIDNNEELYDFQRKYFNKSQYGPQIRQHVGRALEVIPRLDTEFDLVFIDADKANYSNYLGLVVPKLKKGGILLTDNVLWYGKVLKPTKPKDKDTKLIKEFNDKLHHDPRLESILLPIRDGLFLSRKP